MRRIRTMCGLGAVGLVLFGLAPGAASASERRCGTKELYGRTLTIWLFEGEMSCAKVRRIVRGRCRARKVWSCFSFHPPAPLLTWFPERERFAPDWSSVIEARRYPCGEPRVTADAWKRAEWHGFPTLRQVLADDLLRCDQLHAMTYRRVRRLLGRPDERWTSNGNRGADWELGPERDSFFQIDSEFLSVRFDRAGVFRSADVYQG